MDPYLEHSDLWRSVHGLFISEATRALNLLLPEKYYARNDVRTYETSDRFVYPDVNIELVREQRAQYRTGTSIAEPPDEPAVAHFLPFEMREDFLEIRATADSRKVTIIELLSHSNKAA